MAHARGRVRPIGQLCNMDPAIDSVQPDTGRLYFACPAFLGSRSTPSVPTPRVEVGFVIPHALCDGRAAPISQELGEKTLSKHGGILVGADRGALQDDRGGARHSEKLGLVPPQPHSSAARSSCGVSRPAPHTWQLLSRTQGAECGKRGRSSLRRARGVPSDGRARGWGGGGGRQARGAVLRDGAQRAYPIGNERKWARLEGNEFVQTLAQSTVWARNLSKVGHFGQDFGPYPNFGLGEGPVGERFVFSKPEFRIA
jgi:hypothetical protein